MFTSSFARRRQKQIPQPNNRAPIVRQDMRGLDMVTPYSAMQDNRSPFAKNFRVYAEESNGRRVSVQDRRGSGTYTTPLGETKDASFESTTGLTGELLGVNSNWKAQSFVAGTTGPLTSLELYLQNDGNGQGAIVVEVREDNAGKPGNKIADSGVYGSDLEVDAYGYAKVRFIEAPAVTSTDTYWIVAYIQEDGAGTYLWGAGTGTGAFSSDSSGLDWTSLSKSLLFKVNISDATDNKNVFRFSPDSGENVTLAAVGNNMYTVNDTTGAYTSIASGLNSNATEYSFMQMDGKVFWVNGYDDLKTWDGTTVETITHSQLPILSQICSHKERLFGVSAEETSKVIWSEVPGNDDGAGNFWYKAYLSTSYFYFPSPESGSRVVGILSWQDALQVFTDNDKYVLHGDTPAQFRRRQSLGRKGAVGWRSIYADENYIYFLSDDGVYRFNGSADEIISDRVQPEIEGISKPREAFMTKWKRQVRLYYSEPLSGVNNKCLLWHTVLEEWEMDTDSYVSFALPLTDGDDEYELIEASSVAPVLTYAEKGRDNLGKAIDFEYHCKYDSMDNPAMKKRITKFFPMLEGEGGDYVVKVGVDKDLEDNTRFTDFPLETQGITIGSFLIGDGTKIGRIFSFAPERIRVSGYGYFWQVRIKKRAINNPVKFNGYVLAIRTKRL